MLQCNDIDGLMVDWLYGELDDAQATRVSGHVDACSRCQAEQAAFSRTRQLFSGLPEQEPPSALTAMLVREAALSAKPAKAAKAAAPEENSGGFAEWLTRLFRPMMHPAAAAVATLVVVVGVAGALYMKKGSDQFAEPRAASTMSDEASGEKSPPPATLAAADDKAPVDREEEASEAPGEGSEQFDPRVADLVRPEQNAKLTNERRKAGVVGGTAAPARVAKAKKKRPAAKRTKNAPIADNELDAFADADTSDASKDEAFGYRGQKAGWASSREGDLLRAYKAEDCKKTAEIANDIRDRDPSHYKANTAELEAVKKCRFYVQKERKRRTSVARKRAAERAQKSKADTKASGSSVPKAAAKEELDAVETTTE